MAELGIGAGVAQRVLKHLCDAGLVRKVAYGRYQLAPNARAA